MLSKFFNAFRGDVCYRRNEKVRTARKDSCSSVFGTNFTKLQKHSQTLVDVVWCPTKVHATASTDENRRLSVNHLVKSREILTISNDEMLLFSCARSVAIHIHVCVRAWTLSREMNRTDIPRAKYNDPILAKFERGVCFDPLETDILLLSDSPYREIKILLSCQFRIPSRCVTISQHADLEIKGKGNSVRRTKIKFIAKSYFNLRAKFDIFTSDVYIVNSSDSRRVRVVGDSPPKNQLFVDNSKRNNHNVHEHLRTWSPL